MGISFMELPYQRPRRQLLSLIPSGKLVLLVDMIVAIVCLLTYSSLQFTFPRKHVLHLVALSDDAARS